MATTSTMNQWLEQLAVSLTPQDLPPSTSRRIKHQFIRGVRHHNYGRTNQFEVEERLEGLEEKFQVLNFDDMSDELRRQRAKLRQFQQQWVPDVLDLLLRISGDPMTTADQQTVTHGLDADATVSRLTWADIEKDDPIDLNDRLWKHPVYSDFSSDEEFMVSSSGTSPASMKSRAQKRPNDDFQAVWWTADSDLVPQHFVSIGASSLPATQLTEIQIVRETLFMVQGLPTKMFSFENGQLRRQFSVKSTHLSDRTLDSVLSRATAIYRAADVVRKWSFPGKRLPFINRIEDDFAALVANFDSYIAKQHEDVIRIQQWGGVCSLLQVVEAVHDHAPSLLAVANLISSFTSDGPVALLDGLFGHACKYQHIGDARAFTTLAEIFVEAMMVFTNPIAAWVEQGFPPDGTVDFFITKLASKEDKVRLWHNWFSLNSQEPSQLPTFLMPLANRMFVAGKTAAFAHALQSHVSAEAKVCGMMVEFRNSWTTTQRSFLPFGPFLVESLNRYVEEHLAVNTQVLKTILEEHCKLQEALVALSHIYFSESPHVTSQVDAEVFSRLDCARNTWNDRFVVADVLVEAFSQIEVVDTNRVSVQSEPVSNLANARRSVQVLEFLTIEYNLPWPIANIISTDDIASYRRVSLMLCQIRRARHALETLAYFRPRSVARSRKVVEGTHSNLILFVNIVQSHFMHCVVRPMAIAMRAKLSGTFDEMIAIHKAYTTTLERSCLVTRNLRLVRETLLSLLDLCVDFGFRMADSKTPFDDFALSKTRTQFRKLMSLFIAGLHGAARAESGEEADSTPRPVANCDQSFSLHAGDLIELLAKSLESAQFKM